MLKESLIVGYVAGLMFRSRAMAADNDAEGAPAAPSPVPPMTTPPAAEPQPVATVAGSNEIPWPELPHMMTAEAAVSEFLDELVEYHGAGAALRFAFIASYYRAFGPRHGWPPLKDKTLSRMLCDGLGCTREQREMRAAGEGRPTFITLVPAQAVDEDEVLAEPMRIAA